MRDEMGFIDACLDSFAVQTYGTDQIEVLVVDAGSRDGSSERVRERAADEPWIRVLDNPKGSAAAAFNVGTHAARGEVTCLFSSHGVAHPEYVSASIAVLEETGADGVGGRYLHLGLDRRSQAIGLAMVSPVGMASPHRFASHRREVDTISHPAYRTESLRAVGPFDESLARNSDYELNHRLRDAGASLMFDPSIESVYRPRPTLVALARQFWWYGRWKVRVLEQQPGALKPRHLVAPAAAVVALSSPAIATVPAGRRVLGLAAVGYALVVATGTALARPRRNEADILSLALAFPVMHASWGVGFLTSVGERIKDRSQP